MNIRSNFDATIRLLLSVAISASVSCYGAKALADDPTAVPLKYGLQKGKSYGYEYNVEYESNDNQKRTAKGFVTFQIEATNVDKNLSGESFESIEDGEATGTAFAVTEDGYLLTCAHCVRGATKVQVVYQGRDYLARLVDINYELDLAIIKISVKKMPTVNLGKTVQVQLAQDVRAIGYPLSDVLGSSVKVTRGGVAGFVDENGKKNIQVDVAVNHGNSGGPLVDDTGAVVGVVNAKLSGRSISKVGFAVPIRYACEMLERNKISVDSTPRDKLLSGVQIAKELTPAVLFVKTELGPGGHGEANFRIRTNGSINRSGNAKSPGTEVVQSQFIVNQNGGLIDSKDEVNLPLLSGPVCMMPFEKLPPLVKSEWTEEEAILLPLPKSLPKVRGSSRGPGGFPRTPFGPRPSRFGGFGFDGFGIPGRVPGFGGSRFGHPYGPQPPERRESEKLDMRIALAKSTTKFKIMKTEGDLVSIFREHRLKTVDDEDAFASLDVSDKGTLKFDRKQGIFVSKMTNGSFQITLGKEKVKFATKLNYRNVTKEEFIGATPVVKNPVPIDRSAQIKQFAKASIEDYSKQDLLTIVNVLASCPVTAEYQTVISAKLQSILTNRSNGISEKLVVDALLNWDSEAATPHVIRGFNRASVFAKRSWISKLGKTGSSDAARVLCGLIVQPRSRSAAAVALVKIGGVAEPAVISALQSAKSTDDFKAYLDILAKIGGDPSLKAIEALAGKPNWPKITADRAMRSIKSR